VCNPTGIESPERLVFIQGSQNNYALGVMWNHAAEGKTVWSAMSVPKFCSNLTEHREHAGMEGGVFNLTPNAPLYDTGTRVLSPRPLSCFGVRLSLERDGVGTSVSR